MTVFNRAAIAFVVGMSACGLSIAQSPGPRPNVLLKQLVEGMPRGEKQEVTILTATVLPGEKTPFHSHRFPVGVYILEGTFTLELEGRAPIVLKAGEAAVEPPNVRMTGYNRSTEPMRVVIFYVSEPGGPFFDVVQ